jgi:hypothetical protein
VLREIDAAIDALDDSLRAAGQRGLEAPTELRAESTTSHSRRAV